MQTSVLVDTYGSICVATPALAGSARERNDGNALAVKIAGAKSPTEKALKNVQKW